MLGFYISMLETEHEKKRMADVYYAYQLRWLFIARKITKDDDLAEDAVHNAILNLLSKKDLLALPDEELNPLMITIVKRRAYDILEQRQRQVAESLDVMESIPSPDESVEIQIETAEDYQRLRECLKSLAEPHRIVLQMKYFSELSNKEIGEYLGITTKHVETKLYRAKLKLRKIYYEEGSINA